MVKVLSQDVENAIISVQILHHSEIQHINTVGTVKAAWLEVCAETFESSVDREKVETEFEKLLEKKMSEIDDESPGGSGPIAAVPSSTFKTPNFEEDASIESETSSEVPRSDCPESVDDVGERLTDEAREQSSQSTVDPPDGSSKHESPKHVDSNSLHVIPRGKLPFSSVVNLIEGVKSKQLSARDLLASMVRDGAARSIQGEILRAVLQHDLDPHGMAAQVLGKIRSVELKDNVLAINFNTTRRYIITMPASKKWVLHSKNRKDPFLVHRQNRAYESAREARKFSLAPTVRLNVTEEGITSIAKGDVMVKSLIKLNVDMNTQRAEGKIATDRSGRPYLIVDKKTKRPLVVGGKYQPQIFDEW
eukprot:CAMPEP_0170197968 /NCGR_PEP_ID=MMETSP0040_2-20121228/67656_1 /TAXON_ID=641309 /ORGANISM="Lotharella oceanica, Strain CCMP622" /LENGTH=362 /DNA_ID=CAMNT_0010447791 /DNA_START=165 /DNA_END=1250 /DNA_ORIENTATION=+